MVYLGEVRTILTELESIGIPDPPAPAQGPDAGIYVFTRCPANWTDPLDLTNVLSDFVLDRTEIEQIRKCIRDLVDKNGAEWVWDNKEIVSDFLEFHGFNRKKGSLERPLDSSSA